MPDLIVGRRARRLALLCGLGAVLTFVAVLPTGVAGAAIAPPICDNTLGANAAFGVETDPTLVGQTVKFDGSCSRVAVDTGLSSVPPDGYNWNFGDGSTNDGDNPTPTHVYSQPGTYNVTLEVWSKYGDTRTITQQVYVLSP